MCGANINNNVKQINQETKEKIFNFIYLFFFYERYNQSVIFNVINHFLNQNSRLKDLSQ